LLILPQHHAKKHGVTRDIQANCEHCILFFLQISFYYTAFSV